MNEPDDAHELTWQKLYNAVDVVFRDFSQQGMIGEHEYFIVEDDWGWNRVQTELVISSLWPQIARKFQLILADFPKMGNHHAGFTKQGRWMARHGHHCFC